MHSMLDSAKNSELKESELLNTTKKSWTIREKTPLALLVHKVLTKTSVNYTTLTKNSFEINFEVIRARLRDQRIHR